MAELRRNYVEEKLRARGKLPPSCQIAQAMAAEVWHWLWGLSSHGLHALAVPCGVLKRMRSRERRDSFASSPAGRPPFP